MIYTIGRRDRYEPAFALMERLNREGRGVPITKSGKGITKDGRPYDGGWAWRSESEARAFIAASADHQRDVYGVLADWESGTEQIEGEPYRRLLRDSEMVRLGSAPKDGTG
ncbi:MAG: hypothetical protein ABI399_10885 [Bauldia sp.]